MPDVSLPIHTRSLNIQTYFLNPLHLVQCCYRYESWASQAVAWGEDGSLEPSLGQLKSERRPVEEERVRLMSPNMTLLWIESSQIAILDYYCTLTSQPWKI